MESAGVLTRRMLLESYWLGKAGVVDAVQSKVREHGQRFRRKTLMSTKIPSGSSPGSAARETALTWWLHSRTQAAERTPGGSGKERFPRRIFSMLTGYLTEFADTSSLLSVLAWKTGRNKGRTAAGGADEEED
jgi:hypothetical protein